MHFKLEDVIRFANEVKTKIPSNIKKPVYFHSHWFNHELELNGRKRDCERAPCNQNFLPVYASALANAATYLVNKSKTGSHPTEDRLSFIDSHTRFLHSKVNSPAHPFILPIQVNNSPDIPPKPAPVKATVHSREHVTQTTSRTSEIKKAALSFLGTVVTTAAKELLPKTAEATLFFESDEFKSFVKYRDFLKNDERSHTFFGVNLDLHKEKYEIMNYVVTLLQVQTDIDGIRLVLDTFAAGKGQLVSYDDGKTYKSSFYDILNMGQNITTFILGLFGLINTTSINRFNLMIKKAEEISYESGAESRMKLD
ncbi:hypothetical protein [Legionella shakespearei]|uniref:Uncharacterized protein n=1 Tax=Legionella shakespearei DSM 23087 TaxID=1122169 RepID=A0A0W0YI08_9GAMM|nr:hypothetical protein [Legionella shakespearei]KTD56528.1 hypothetical protein Lsha_2787 [Legionella shakespearei DSM 23087]